MFHFHRFSLTLSYSDSTTLKLNYNDDTLLGKLSNVLDNEEKTLKLIILYIELIDKPFIAFKNGNIVISHRVKEVINDSGTYKFKTKGDNNNVADDFIVSSDAIEGIFVNKIPGLGSILLFLGKPIGLLMVILVIIIVSTALYFVKFGYSTKDAELMREFQEFKRNKELNNNK